MTTSPVASVRSLPRRAFGFLAARRPRPDVVRLPAYAVLLACLVLAVSLPALLVYAAPAVAAPRWVPPVTPVRVVRAFRPPPAPWAAGHRGVDLAAGADAEVVSAGAGVVVFAGRVAGRGVVVVRTGDLRTTYEPVSPRVRVGQVVRPGDPLGALSGATHCAPRVCLHWGLLRGETYLDPLTLLTRRAVRLLPLDGPVVAASEPRADRAPAAPALRPVAETSAPPDSRPGSPPPRRGSVPVPLTGAVLVAAGVALVVNHVDTRRDARPGQSRRRTRRSPFSR